MVDRIRYEKAQSIKRWQFESFRFVSYASDHRYSAIIISMIAIEVIRKVRKKYQALAPIMDEKVRRLWAGSEAISLGWGGIAAVSMATGMSRPTIRAGMKEVVSGEENKKKSQESKRRTQIRSGGGGRSALIEGDRRLLKDLKSLVESSTRGDPSSPLLWTSKSTRHLANALVEQVIK